MRLAAQRAFIICESFFRPAALMPLPFPPDDFFAEEVFFELAVLPCELPLPPRAAFVRAQRARAASAIRCRPSAERERRRRPPFFAALPVLEPVVLDEPAPLLVERPEPLSKLSS